MRKVLVTFAALVLCAAPVYAQQGAEPAAAAEQSDVVKAAAPAPAAQPAEQNETRTPTLAVSRDEIRARIAADEPQASEQMGGQGFWWTVAAVAIGVIVALLLID